MKNQKIFVMGMLVLLVACSEQKEFQQVNRPQSEENVFIEKTQLPSTQEEYLYVPLAGATPRSLSAMMPQYLGQEKVVKFEIREDELKIVQIDRDERFRGNPTNRKPVMTIPLEHLDYKCAEDDYGRCTNKEEEDEDKKWQDRRYVNLKLKEQKVEEFNLLPIDLANLFGRQCYQKESQSILDAKISRDAIIITTEETYFDACGGVFSLLDIEDKKFRIMKHYNFVRLSTIASQDYEPLVYPLADQNILGLFKTERNVLGSDYNPDYTKRRELANRWNPKRNKITYYLSSDFSLPENDVILKATEYAVEAINRSLAIAEANFTIELKQGSDQQIQDIRNSMIVMVSEPVESRILGYGPSFVNPHTGETISGRTVMYKGNLVTMIAREYDLLIRERLEEMQKQEATLENRLNDVIRDAVRILPAASFGIPGYVAHDDLSIMQFQESSSSLITQNEQHIMQENTNRLALQEMGRTNGFGNLKNSKKVQLDTNFIRRTQSPAMDHLRQQATIKEYLEDVPASARKKLKPNLLHPAEAYANHNAYHEEMVNISKIVSSGLDGIIDELQMRPWESLSDEEKKKVIDHILPGIWIPVLTHELGHNLGLRHNFSASEDKENFYNQEELNELGLERAFHYSSVMDYALHEAKFLPIMGKYDIATLRYAYAGKVEVVKDSGKVELVKVKGLLSEVPQRKAYQYCSDEGISLNPTCNPFDVGTNYNEISSFQAEKRGMLYRYRYTRNGRNNFSLYDDINAYFSARRDLYYMRLFFDLYENIRDIPSLRGYDWELGNYPPGMDQESKIFLADINAAVENTGNYLIDLLLEPDAVCALVDTKGDADPSNDENFIYQLTGLNEAFRQVAKNCFEVRLPNNLVAVGQIGKPFNPIGTNTSQYADQIDVRGKYIDKLAAIEILFQERQNNRVLDRVTSNYLTHPRIGPKLLAATTQMLLDEVRHNVTMDFIDGSSQTMPFSYQPSKMFKMQSRIHPVVDYFLNIRSGHRSLAQEMVRRIKKSINDLSDPNLRQEQLAIYSVQHGRTICSAYEDRVVVGGNDHVFCAASGNLIAKMLIDRIVAFDAMSPLPEKRIQELLTDLESGKKLDMDNYEEAEQAVLSTDVGLIKMYLSGSLRSRDVYTNALYALADH